MQLENMYLIQHTDNSFNYLCDNESNFTIIVQLNIKK